MAWAAKGKVPHNVRVLKNGHSLWSDCFEYNQQNYRRGREGVEVLRRENTRQKADLKNSPAKCATLKTTKYMYLIFQEGT